MPELSRPREVDLPPELSSLPLAELAWSFATDAHGDQLRKGDGAPYMVHPAAVASLVVEHGGDEEMAAAALLHDVVEDTATSADAVVDRFGAGVGGLVIALSDDPRIGDYARRKRALRAQVEEAGERAQQIYAADKLANSRDLLRAYSEQGEAISGRYSAPIELRLLLWREDLSMLEARLGRTPLLERLGEALDELDRALAAGRDGSRP